MELKLKDLIEDCQKCSGTGKDYSKKSVCGLNIIADADCPEFEGKGVKLTECGETLKKFVEILKSKEMI